MPRNQLNQRKYTNGLVSYTCIVNDLLINTFDSPDCDYGFLLFWTKLRTIHQPKVKNRID